MRGRSLVRLAAAAALSLIGLAGCTDLNKPGLDCSGTTPKYCPALEDAPETCGVATADCSTVTQCSSNIYSCETPNTYVDCGSNQCVPTSTCMDISGYTDPCERCFIRKCCAEWGVCNTDPNCDSTDNDAAWQALSYCTATYCYDVCTSA